MRPTTGYGRIAGCLLCLACLVSGGSAGAIDLDTWGSWTETINSADLAAGAGSNLISTCSSDASAGYITVSNSAGNTWRVDVRRSDTTWDANVTLKCRRTGSGTGSYTPTGGQDYVTISGTDQSFFSGEADTSDIPVQFQLGGLSVGAAVGTYSTTVIYTVVDTQ